MAVMRRILTTVAMSFLAACSATPSSSVRPVDPSHRQAEVVSEAILAIGAEGFGEEATLLARLLETGRIKTEANQVRNQRFTATVILGDPEEIALNPIYVSPEPARFARLGAVLVGAARRVSPGSQRDDPIFRGVGPGEIEVVAP
jgi:hypothetical protein